MQCKCEIVNSVKKPNYSCSKCYPSNKDFRDLLIEIREMLITVNETGQDILKELRYNDTRRI